MKTAAAYKPFGQLPLLLILSAAGLLIMTGFASAREKTGSDLDTLINYVREFHPDVIAAEERAMAAESRVKPAGTLPDPVLTLGQNLTDLNNQRAGITQSFPLWGKRGLASSTAEHEALAAGARVDEARLRAVKILRQAYAEHAYVYAAYEISREQYELLKHLERVVTVSYRAGQTGMSGLLRIQAEADKQRAQTQTLQDLKKAASARLNAALGRSPDSPLSQPEPLISIYRETVIPRNLHDIEKSNPELAAIYHELSAREKEISIASRSGYPDLMLGIEAERSRPMGENEIMISAMAGINIPLWRGAYRARREGAAAEYRSLEKTLEQRGREIKADIEILIYKLKEARRNRELYGEILTVRAEQALASVETGYRSGEAGFPELIDTRRELLAYRMAHIRAVADALILTAEIEALTGIPMEAEYEKY